MVKLYKYQHYILLIIVMVMIYFVSSIENNLLRVLIGTPVAAIGVYSANIIGGFGKKRARIFVLLVLIMGAFIFLASLLGALLN